MESIYWECRGNISSCLNNWRHEALLPDLVMIRITRFWILKISMACGEFPQKIIPYVINSGCEMDLKYVSELWLGCLITRLLLVEHLDVWDFSPSDARFLRTLLLCLPLERIKIFSVTITVHYSVESLERLWRTEANTYPYSLIINRNTTYLSVIKQTSQRQNMYWNHGKTSFEFTPSAFPTCCDASSATIFARFRLQQFCFQ